MISDEHIDYKWVSLDDLEKCLDEEIYNDLDANGMIIELMKLDILKKGVLYEKSF